MAYFPNLVPPLKPTATISRTGKTAGGGPTQQQDQLANWEGYRVFRDARSQTGWSDIAGHVVGGIDTHGYILLYNPDTRQVDYNQHHHGGFNLGNVLQTASKVAQAYASGGTSLAPGGTAGISGIAENALSQAGVPLQALQGAALQTVGLERFSAAIPYIDRLAGISLPGGETGPGLREGASVDDVYQGPTPTGATVDSSTGTAGTTSIDTFNSIAGKLAQSRSLLEQLFARSPEGGRANQGAVATQVEGPTQSGATLASVLSGRNLLIGAAIVAAVFLVARRGR